MAMRFSPRTVAPLTAALALAALAPASASLAASAPPAEPSAASLKDTLHLSDDQSPKVDRILQDASSAAKTSQDRYASSVPRLSRELASIERKRDDRLGRVLSPVQLGWFKAWEGKRMAAQLARSMREHLGLSQEQASRVEAIYARAFASLNGISSYDGPTERERQVRAIEAERDGALKSVLSEDQFAKFESAKGDLDTRSRAEVLSLVG